MPRTKSLLRSLLAIGAAGAIAAFGTFSAFSSTTENPGNEIDAGTVALSDNDSGSALYDVSGAKAGTTVDRCITVSYTGLAADVKVYLPDAVGGLAQYVNMTVTTGTDASPTFGDCTGFVADGGAPLYTGTLQGFRTAHSGWANGLQHDPAGQTEWTTGNAVTYRVQLTVQDNNAAQGLGTGTHRIMWEARNN
jgi:hypothetical protein